MKTASRYGQSAVLTPDFRASGGIFDILAANTATDAIALRAETLDTIAAVLPIDRRDKLAEILTDPRDAQTSGQ
ncbi:hypothetical protein FHX03_006644 [Rhizobium sp. BK456]|nr:hypothetical protein [Rhizobium sp. BK456]